MLKVRAATKVRHPGPLLKVLSFYFPRGEVDESGSGEESSSKLCGVAERRFQARVDNSGSGSVGGSARSKVAAL